MGTVQWIVLAIVGFGAGIGLGFWLSKLLRGDDREKLADTEAEFAAYKQEVAQHFSQSAAHFQAIGKQYRELYAHMAVGSEKLCEISGSEEQLKFPRPDEVVLAKSAAGIGAVAAANLQNSEEPQAASDATEEVNSAETQVAVADDVVLANSTAATAEAKGENAAEEATAAAEDANVATPDLSVQRDETQDSEAQDEEAGEGAESADLVDASGSDEPSDGGAAPAGDESAADGDAGNAPRAAAGEQALNSGQPLDYVKDEAFDVEPVQDDTAAAAEVAEKVAVAAKPDVLEDVGSPVPDSADNPETRLYH